MAIEEHDVCMKLAAALGGEAHLQEGSYGQMGSRLKPDVVVMPSGMRIMGVWSLYRQVMTYPGLTTILASLAAAEEGFINSGLPPFEDPLSITGVEDSPIITTPSPNLLPYYREPWKFQAKLYI